MVTIIARSVRGLEWVAADEISAALPEASGLAMSSREVTFLLPDLAQDLLGLRTVDDVFVQAGRVPGVSPGKAGPATAAAGVADLDWAGALAPLGAIRAIAPRPRLDVVASLEGRRNYNRFAVENAVGDLLARRLHGSYLARTSSGRQAGETDLMVRVFVRGSEAVTAVEVAAQPLHRRGYKQESGPGTLHPPMAAALARLARPAPGDTVADPFCGDGTIAIETALSYPAACVLASDIDDVRLGHAERNAARAGLPLTLRQADAAELPWPDRGIDAVITNPPWNIAVDARGLLRRSLGGFWRQLPRLLTPGGRVCLISDAQLDAPAQLRQMGYQLALATQVRLAGRVSHVLLCAPREQRPPRIPAGLAGWRRLALAEGLITETGFSSALEDRTTAS
ncbi:MAG: methyltransferase domain-containing protein [Streptosporangiaceae bacterium]